MILLCVWVVFRIAVLACLSSGSLCLLLSLLGSCVSSVRMGFLCLFDLFCFLSAEVKVFMFETGVVDPLSSKPGVPECSGLTRGRTLVF